MSSDPRYTLFAARAVFDDRLTPTDVRVLAALGTFTNRQGWCRPSQTTIAKRIGLNRSTVNVSIKALVAAGYVQTVKQARDNGAQTVSLYRVLMDLPAPEAVDEMTEGAEILDFEPVVHANTTAVSKDNTQGVAATGPKQPQNTDPTVSQDNTPPLAGTTPPVVHGQHRTFPLETKKLVSGPVRLPGNWSPRQAEVQFGVQGGLSEAEVHAAAEHMRDWAEANNKRKANWDLTFRNWLRTAISDAKRGRRPVVTNAPDYAVALRIWDKSNQKFWDRDKYGPAPNEPGYRGPTDTPSKAQGSNP